MVLGLSSEAAPDLVLSELAEVCRRRGRRGGGWGCGSKFSEPSIVPLAATTTL